jgi:enamine deaminase RidA (YjgF/YER057c/UK114 family)
MRGSVAVVVSRPLALIAMIVVATGCATMKFAASGPAGVTRTFLNPTWLGPAPADFTQTVAVSGGQTVYVSAQTAWDSNRNAVVGPGDFRAQAVRAFERLKVAVEAANASLADVVRLTIYVKDYRPQHLDVLREVLASNFQRDAMPARTVVGVPMLERDGLLIAVEAIAVNDVPRR